MAILATFIAGDLSPYLKDCFEDPLDLPLNPPKEGEVDVVHSDIT